MNSIENLRDALRVSRGPKFDSVGDGRGEMLSEALDELEALRKAVLQSSATEAEQNLQTASQEIVARKESTKILRDCLTELIGFVDRNAERALQAYKAIPYREISDPDKRLQYEKNCARLHEATRICMVVKDRATKALEQSTMDAIFKAGYGK